MGARPQVVFISSIFQWKKDAKDYDMMFSVYLDVVNLSLQL